MLKIEDITCRIAGRVILDGASAFIPEGHKVGLVGRNGSGKTTLFKVIEGEMPPESGRISLPRGARIGRVAQEAPAGATSLIDTVLAADTERLALLDEAETATDPGRIADIHIRLADIDAHSAPSRAAALLAGLGFSEPEMHRACSEFSGGWRMRVALAALLFSEPDLLLLDEPTNYLDLEGAMWLEDYVARYPRTVLIVSHDRDFLNRAVDAILHLERGKLTLYTGGFDTFQKQRAMQAELLRAAKDKIDTQRKHMQSFVDRFRAKASKARQAQSRLKALQKLQPIVLPEGERVAPIVFPKTETLSPPILALEDVSCGYDGRTVLSHLSLRIDADDRIALLGKNGNGKSTFAKLIAERLSRMSGTATRASKLKVGYFAQHQLDELDMDGTAMSHMARLMKGEPESKVRARCGFFGFGVDKVLTKVSNLSGGEKARLLLALAAFNAPHLIVLDEPTNHLDIEAREALMEAINEYDGAVVIVSHDRHLLETSVDTLWLVADGSVRRFDGDMDEYEDYVLGRTPKKAKPAPEKAKPAAAASAHGGGSSNLRKRADQAEKDVARLSAELGAIEAELANPALYAQAPAKLAELSRSRDSVAKKLAAAEALWLDTTAALEG